MITLTTINTEQFFGIVPIDEVLIIPDQDIIEIVEQNADAIALIETRKPDALYEALKEKES